MRFPVICCGLVLSGGGAATRALHDRILACEVTLQVVKRDGDTSLQAVVLEDGENVNGWMMKQCRAWNHRGFAQDAQYCAWEDAARSLKRGLWREPEWVSPWDWRNARRDALHFPTDYRNASTASCMRELREAPVLDE